MEKMTTIQLTQKTLAELKAAKEHPRQSYDDLVFTMTKAYLALKKRNQYDEFLHKIQQPKMKELWDNEADEEWKHA